MAPTSRIDFTPAHTTPIGVWPSVVRSADSSQVSRASRCTPPSPPVANTRMPTRLASNAVLATVVAPSLPRAAAGPRSRTLSLAICSAVAMCSSSASLSPTTGSPRMTPIVAGIAAFLAHDGFELMRQDQVVGLGQAVRDQRALERDDRGAPGQRFGDLGAQANACLAGAHGSSPRSVAAKRGVVRFTPGRVTRFTAAAATFA